MPTVKHVMQRHASLFAVLLGGLVFLSATGCGSSNPNISAAESALEDQNYDQALQSVNTEIDNNPKNAEAYRLKGEILYQQAQNTEAPERRAEILGEMMSAYDRATEINPEIEDQVRLRLIQTYGQEFERGVKAYNKAQKQGDPAAYREAAGYLEGASKIRPDSASAPLYQAFAYINAGDPGKAVDPMRRAVEAGADSASNYVILSQLYQQNDQADEAIALLEEATTKYPDNAELQSQLLNAYVRSGDTERAMTAYEEAIERNPQNATYRYNYGSMLLNAERYDEAIEQLTRALEMKPGNVNAQYNLGAAYVNKAVGVNEQIVEMDEKISQEAESLSKQEIEEMQGKMKTLSDRRTELFRQAIEPLEAARQALQQGAGDTNLDEQQICRSLYTAYAQTNQVDKAKQIEDCAGMSGAGQQQGQQQP